MGQNDLMANQARHHYRMLGWCIYFTGILYYCFAYLLRVFPSCMELNLETHFQIHASQLSTLLAAYYVAYSPSQLFVGPALDRFGPRKCILFACCCATLGTLLFTVSNFFGLAYVGRLCMGLGAAFGYITALKLALMWLPPRFFAAATGAVTGTGMIVAFTTNKYLTEIVQTAGYRTALYFCFTLSVGLLLLLFLMVKEKKDNLTEAEKNAATMSLGQFGRYLIAIVKKPQMWLIGIVGTLLYLPAIVFSDVWGVPYLENVYRFTPEQASTGILFMSIGWTVSSFAAGALSDLFNTRKLPLVIAGFGGTIISSLLLFSSVPVNVVYLLLFMLGLCCGPHPLCFTISKEVNPAEFSGTAMAFCNFLIMIGGIIFQPAVGHVLDYRWQGAALNGLRIYTSADYTFALSIIPIGLMIGAILSLSIRETLGRKSSSRASEPNIMTAEAMTTSD